MADGLETRVQQTGRELAAAMPSMARHPLKALDDRALQLASEDAGLRAALFRFVDVAPACRSLDDLARHLTSFLTQVDDRPPPLEAALRVADTRGGRAALGAAAAAGVRHLAHRFIVGETPREISGLLRSLWRRGVATTVDLLGEATVTAAEADRYAERCRDALRELAGVYARLPARPVPRPASCCRPTCATRPSSSSASWSGPSATPGRFPSPCGWSRARTGTRR